MRFACDVKLSGVSLVAERRHCGEAFPWSPGDNPDPLVAFVGEQFVAVGDGVYRKDVNGTLLPLDLKTACVFLRPVAGDALVQLSVDDFAQSWAVLEDEPAVVVEETAAVAGSQTKAEAIQAKLDADIAEAWAPFIAMRDAEIAAVKSAEAGGADPVDFDFSAPEPLPPVEDGLSWRDELVEGAKVEFDANFAVLPGDASPDAPVESPEAIPAAAPVHEQHGH